MLFFAPFVAAIAEDEKQDVSANKRQITVVESLIKILQQKVARIYNLQSCTDEPR